MINLLGSKVFMEIWDLYDKERVKTGETVIRGRKFNSDRYRVVVHICIFNSDGKILIQHRQPFKKGWSNLWDISVGGHIISGETSSQGAEREVFEELGYKINLENIRPSLTINFDSGFDDIYIIKSDVDIGSLSLQYEEVSEVKWASVNEIFSMIDNGTFIPYHKSYIQILYDMKDYMGAHKK